MDSPDDPLKPLRLVTEFLLQNFDDGPIQRPELRVKFELALKVNKLRGLVL